jgi:hypothetical protein
VKKILHFLYGGLGVLLLFSSWKMSFERKIIKNIFTQEKNFTYRRKEGLALT